MLSARDNLKSKLADVMSTVSILRLENDVLRVEAFRLRHAAIANTLSPTRRGSEDAKEAVDAERPWAADLGLGLDQWEVDGVTPSLSSAALLGSTQFPPARSPAHRARGHHRHAASEPLLGKKVGLCSENCEC